MSWYALTPSMAQAMTSTVIIGGIVQLIIWQSNVKFNPSPYKDISFHSNGIENLYAALPPKRYLLKPPDKTSHCCDISSIINIESYV